MKDFKCPVCLEKSVPFWPVFWGFGPFKTVSCAHCGTHLKQGFGVRGLYSLVTYVPGIAIGLVLLVVVFGYPLIGIPLFFAASFGFLWLTAIVIPLKPARKQPEGAGVARTPEVDGPPDGA